MLRHSSLTLLHIRQLEAVKRLTVVVLCLLCLVLWDCRNHNFFESRVALNPEQDSVRDAVSAIITHKA